MVRGRRGCSWRWQSRLALVLVLTIIFVFASLIWKQAETFAQSAPGVRRIVVILNKSQIIRFAKPVKTAAVGSPAIADIKPMTDRTLYVQGKALGTTNISVFDENMQLEEIVDLEVTIDTKYLQQKIQASTGNRAIQVSASNGEVVLSGMASDSVAADRAVSVAQSMLKLKGLSLVNAMTVAPSQQVMLKVRFLEATRTAERDLGVNWFGTNPAGTRGFSTGLGNPNIPPQASNGAIAGASLAGTGTTNGVANTGGISVLQSTGALLSASGSGPFGVVLANLVNNGTGNLDVMVSALESKGLVRRLAEPNLVTLSGDTAKFLAGGQFPVPQVQSTTNGGATPTFQYVPYGVSLSFVPTVLSAGLMNLRIAPEVSELDYTNAVTISGTTIPSLITRNAQTTIELRDGQSFAIAGLLENRNVRNIQQIPWIGSVPVLGALFRSSAYQNNETDLVIIVTAHLVRPGTPVDHLATPLDKRLPANDVDFFVNGQMEVPKQYSDYVTSGGGMRGPYGAIIPVEPGSNQPVHKGGVAK